jgi:hypothetical protein
MSKILISLILLVFLVESASAATIYLRDRTRIEKAEIIGEVPEAFHIRKMAENYSLVYSYHTVNKGDIFCIIDDKGEIRFPISLLMPSPDRGELSPSEFQRMLLEQQKSDMREMNGHLSAISTIMFIEFLAGATAAVIIATQ